MPQKFEDSILEQMTNISKAHAYDIVSKQRDELIEENKLLREELKRKKQGFYMDICRAYNAGKENMSATIKAEKLFVSSHDYFNSEFPNP